MTKSLIRQAKEIQTLAGKFLSQGHSYTDVEEWQTMQAWLSQGMDDLMRQEGTSVEEEAERVLAVLMGYTIAVRNARHIASILECAERVWPYVTDKILKCHLAVFCYGECWDEELLEQAYGLIADLKATGQGEEVRLVEELLATIQENSGCMM